ncbi:hypothetical protein QG37_01895 [Candidozyma auris]|uniref:Uncharacterized protein n=1 Tax=Candidozyma auris TaxID=498019 RepID=A0A0L0P3U0_CANAR|nr:hypothetical protein QG37_01895 [[Candida] auris]
MGNQKKKPFPNKKVVSSTHPIRNARKVNESFQTRHFGTMDGHSQMGMENGIALMKCRLQDSISINSGPRKKFSATSQDITITKTSHEAWRCAS